VLSTSVIVPSVGRVRPSIKPTPEVPAKGYPHGAAGWPPVPAIGATACQPALFLGGWFAVAFRIEFPPKLRCLSLQVLDHPVSARSLFVRRRFQAFGKFCLPLPPPQGATFRAPQVPLCRLPGVATGVLGVLVHLVMVPDLEP
jgi:hypothetical protein